MKQLGHDSFIAPLTHEQTDQLEHFEALARDLNRKINLYSAASVEDFQRRHARHALMLSIKGFPAGARVVDWGTGGGVPGIPLAIAFPDAEFVLIDKVSKKVRAVQTIARRLGVTNVEAWSGRAEEWTGSLTHSVSRATSPLSTLWAWHLRAATTVSGSQETSHRDEWSPGLICLKGGELDAEVADLANAYPNTRVEIIPLATVTSDAYFEKKSIVQVVTPAS